MLTLSSDTPVAGDAHTFTNPVLSFAEMLLVLAPAVLLLKFVRDVVVLGEDQGGHHTPLGDGWAMNPT